MKEYEQQIDDLINTGDVNNWRLALELCRGLIEDAELVIGTKCLTYVQPYYIDFAKDMLDFIGNECDCTWHGGVSTIRRNSIKVDSDNQYLYNHVF